MADFNSLNPDDQKRVMEVIARQFSNGTRVNQSRAKEAMSSNPQYAKAMMGRAGIGSADNNDAGDAVGSAIQMAITNSLRDSGEAPSEAKAAPTAKSGKSSGAKSMKPMQRSANSSEGGREARNAASGDEAGRESRRAAGFSKIANGDSASAGDGSTDMTGPAMVGGGAAGMYALYRMLRGNKAPQMPAEANQPAQIEGPGARRGALNVIDDAQYTTMDEITGPRSDAPQVGQQRALPAPQRMIGAPEVAATGGVVDDVAGAYEPSPQDMEVMQSILMRGPQGMTSNPNTPPWAVDAGAPAVNPRAPNMRDTISKGLRKQLYGVGRF